MGSTSDKGTVSAISSHFHSLPQSGHRRLQANILEHFDRQGPGERHPHSHHSILLLHNIHSHSLNSIG
jgi:hypothetical protein